MAVGIGLTIVVGMTLDATAWSFRRRSGWRAGSDRHCHRAAVHALRTASAGTDDEADESAAAKRSAWRLLIPLGWIVAAAAVIGPLGGYVAFGRFVSSELVVVAAVLMSFVLLSQFADAVIATTFGFHGRAGRLLRQMTGLRNGPVRQIAAVLHGLVQLLLVALAAFVILGRWGINTDDIFDTLAAAFFNFTIGQFNVSLSAIFGRDHRIAHRRVATNDPAMPGSRFAATVSISASAAPSDWRGLSASLSRPSLRCPIGLNLQNIAIVAGALSVGTLRLQSIINNFVSHHPSRRAADQGGRPHQVGTCMGVVKRINVRATEIVTYDNLGDRNQRRTDQRAGGQLDARQFLRAPVGDCRRRL